MRTDQIEIIPVKYGESVLPEHMIFEHGAEKISHPIVFIVYLIKVENRLILVDAGCETMPGFEMKNFIGPIRALEKINVSADDITDIIITHAHHDHIECIKYFNNAKIYIQQDEYEAGKQYFTSNLVDVQVFKDEKEICHNIKAIKIGGHSKGSSIVEIEDGKQKYVIIGDECYLRKCIDEKIPTGVSYCREKSRRFVEKYGNGKYIILLCHDM